MKLKQALRLSGSESIAFTGAGGKTTALFQMARELAPALVTTSTHLGEWQVSKADKHIIWSKQLALPPFGGEAGSGVTVLTGDLADGRYQGVTDAQMHTLRELAAHQALSLLIEADGARQKPLKAPAEHEPAIPGFVDAVVVVCGLSALGKPLTEDTVHRAQLFAKLVNRDLDEPISLEMIATELVHPAGGLKNIPGSARRFVLINQADTPQLQAQAGALSEMLLGSFDRIVIASLLDTNSPAADHDPVFAVYKPIAGIVLAAGGSVRFGRPKQLLDFHGEPFVRKVTRTAIEAGLSPVVVITGANASAVEATLDGLPITIVRNENWRQGQSASLKSGVASLPQRTGGAIFLLADQPQVGPHVIRALVERHATLGAEIVAPLAGDRRANPVLFDQKTFVDLLDLSGDVGGRAIFSRYQVDYVNWQDESLLLDVDTEADYRKLLSWGVEE